MQRTKVAAIVSVGVFVASLDLFIVNIAFPDIERDFHGTSLASLSWILNAYAIVFAALLVPAGRWAEALSEFRAARRMTGRDDYLPIMADCERALGRLDRALALVREGSTAHLDRATQIELRIVESGIRRDQGLSDAAVLALQVPELTRRMSEHRA